MEIESFNEFEWNALNGMESKIPEFSIKECVGWHGVDDFLWKRELPSKSGEHGFLEGIPESSNAIIFLKQPPGVEFVSWGMAARIFTLTSWLDQCWWQS
jgi:hypothetical protein